jgi:ATP-binding cassette, subfamily F, member 3
MSILTLKALSKSFGHKELFENAELNIEKNDKIGLIGKNGQGKTTLLNIITGKEEFHGELIKSDIRIGYFRQIEKIPLELLTIEFILDEKIGSEKYNLNYSKILEIVRELNFQEELLYRNIETLSGGEKTKAFIIKFILESPDLLILDEPTNHLDLEGIDYLEKWLKKYNGTYIIVSHNRDFIEQVANKIFEIEEKKINNYNMNFNDFLEFKEKEKKEKSEKYEKNTKEQRRLKDSVQEKREWLNELEHKFIKVKSEKMRTSRDYGLLEKLVKMDKARKKIGRKMNEIKGRAENINLDKPKTDKDKINIDFFKINPSYNEVLDLKHISFFFEEKQILKKLDLEIKRGEKIFLIGRNGCGKTTLLNIITGKIKKFEGEVKIGENAKVGYLKQEKTLPLELNIIDFVKKEFSEINPQELQTYLAKFLFKGEDIYKKIENLSGGELMRLDLFVHILKGANFLILDEPTNNLDLRSIEVLEDFLKDYPGTLLVVSHDKKLIKNTADLVLEMKNGNIKTRKI